MCILGDFGAEQCPLHAAAKDQKETYGNENLETKF